MAEAEYDALNGNNYERKEVRLEQGDGFLEVKKLIRCIDAVCLIYYEGRTNITAYATGFFASITIRDIEYRVIVTNNHVLNNTTDAANAMVFFRYDGNSLVHYTKLFPETIFFTNKDLDYTIVGCDHHKIERDFGIQPIKFDYEDRIAIGDDIFILQHPEGQTKSLSYQKISNIDRPFVYYNADTDSGSSGSIVVRMFKLIAVHSAGCPALKCNKGTLCSEILNHLNTGKYTAPRTILGSTENMEGKFNISAWPTDVMLSTISFWIITYWYELGIRLNLSVVKLDCINIDNPNVYDKAFKMLIEWREMHGYDATIKFLNDVLIKMGKHATVEKLHSLI